MTSDWVPCSDVHASVLQTVLNLKTNSHSWLEKTRNAHRVLVKKNLLESSYLNGWWMTLNLITGTLVVICEVNGRDWKQYVMAGFSLVSIGGL